MKKTIELTNNDGKKATYQLQNNANYKKLCKYLKIEKNSIYRFNDYHNDFYWCDGYWYGDWFAGGYYHKPYCVYFSDVFVNLNTLEIYKRIK